MTARGKQAQGVQGVVDVVDNLADDELWEAAAQSLETGDSLQVVAAVGGGVWTKYRFVV